MGGGGHGEARGVIQEIVMAGCLRQCPDCAGDVYDGETCGCLMTPATSLTRQRREPVVAPRAAAGILAERLRKATQFIREYAAFARDSGWVHTAEKFERKAKELDL